MDLRSSMHFEIAHLGAVTLETARKVWDNSPELQSLNNRVTELNKTIPDIKVGRILADDASIAEYIKIERETDLIYENIRRCSRLCEPNFI